MKSIKKFSAMNSVSDKAITESAKVTKEAVDELIKKIGFSSIDELKKEKNLLSKLEAMSKSFAKGNDISEEEVDRALSVEDKDKKRSIPKSAEGKEQEVPTDEVIVSDESELEETETKLVDDEITKVVPGEEDEVSDEDGVLVADEEVETPKATRRIMAFEDFVKEKEETINKNINYRDDNEEEEDYAVPVAASADPLAESDESRGKDDEKYGDELEDKGDSKVDDEDDKEKADHYKGAVKSDKSQIKSLKKDLKYDKEEEEDAKKNESSVMSFSKFVNEAYDRVVLGGNKGDKSKTKEDEEDYEDEDKKDEAYDRVVLGGNKGDKSKTKEDEEDYEDEDKKDEAYDRVVLGGNKGDKSKTKKGDEDYEDEDKKNVKENFTFADAVDTAGEDVKKNEKGIASVLKALKAKSGSDISIMTDTTEDDDLYDAIEGMKTLPITSTVYDKAYAGKYKGKNVVVFDGGEDLFAYVKEGVEEVITKVEGDEIKDEIAGDDGIAIPVIKGDGPETAAGIAGDGMEKGKVKVLPDSEGEELVSKDQKITSVVKGEGDDLADGTEVVKEAMIAEEDITSDDQFKEYTTAILKKAFGADFDEAKAMEVADGLISKYSGDYGAMVGALQSTMG